EDHVGVLCQRGPGLLAIDDIFVALPLSLGLQRSEIGARTRLGEALAPPVVDIGDARQIILFLRFIAEGVDHRSYHADAKRQRRRRRWRDRKSTRLNSSHVEISYAVFCLKKKKNLILLYKSATKEHMTASARGIAHY